MIMTTYQRAPECDVMKNGAACISIHDFKEINAESLARIQKLKSDDSIGYINNFEYSEKSQETIDKYGIISIQYYKKGGNVHLIDYCLYAQGISGSGFAVYVRYFLWKPMVVVDDAIMAGTHGNKNHDIYQKIDDNWYLYVSK